VEHLLLVLLILYLTVEVAEQFFSILNLKYLAKHGAEVPPGFEKHVDSSALMRMRDYTVEHGRLDRISAVVSMAVTILFLFGGLLNWLNNFVAGLGFTPVVSGVIFFMVLVYGETLISMPFSLYNTFPLKNALDSRTRPCPSG
jgi:STE24 endopeptidase